MFRYVSVVDMKNEIKFEGGNVCVCKNGIVSFTTSVDKLELEHAQGFIDCLVSLGQTTDVLVLFDAKSLKESTAAAVKKYTAEKLEKNATALAVLNNSAVSRFLIHTFLAIYRPNIPVRMFEDEAQAKEWLLEFKAPQ